MIDTFSSETQEKYKDSPLWKPWMTERRLRLINSLTEFEEFLDMGQSFKRISLDFETCDLSQTPESVCGFCLAFTDKEGVYIPIKHANYPDMNLDPDKAWAILLDAIKNRQVVDYNHKFEGNILKRRGFFIPCDLEHLQDAYIYRWLYDSNKIQLNLKDAAFDLVGQEMLKIHDVPGIQYGKKKNQINFALSNPEDATLYAAADPIFTLAVLDHCKPKVDKEQNFIVLLEHTLLRTLFRMEENPIMIDRSFLQQASKDLDHWIDHISRNIFHEAEEEFDLNSPKEVSRVLMRMGVPLKRTKNEKQENYETNAKALESLQRDYPIIANILFYRSIMKEKSTYVEALLNCTSEEKPTAVFKFTSPGAPTGRFSSGGVDEDDSFYAAMNPQAIPSASGYKKAKCRKVTIEGI